MEVNYTPVTVSQRVYYVVDIESPATTVIFLHVFNLTYLNVN